MTSPRIMIIDDEERIRQLLFDYLEDYGFSLRACVSAEEALETLTAEPADLCIVDMRLPGMDGRAFILAAQARGLCSKHILHTGSMDFALTPELTARGLGEEDVYFKPCDMALMLKRIQSLLNLPGDEA